jgi:hypothetical protein
MDIEEIDVPKIDLQKSENLEKTDSNQQAFKGARCASLPFRSAKKPRWLTRTLQKAAKQVDAPSTSFQGSHPPKKFPSYVALMSSTIDIEPSNYEEETRKKVW